MTHKISYQRSPLWPYLLVLTGLFLLSLAVPRGWQDDSAPANQRPLARQRAQARHPDMSSSVAIVQPSATVFAAPTAATPSDADWSSLSAPSEQSLTTTASSTSADLQPSNNAASDFIGPLFETVAKKIADLRHFDPLHYIRSEQDASSNSVSTNANTTNISGPNTSGT